MNNFNKFLSYEDKEHILVVNWLKENLPNVLAFHVPNEGKKSPFERYKASIMGLLKGCPDFIILHPKHSETKDDGNGNKYKVLQYNGLMIELKAPEHNRVVLKGKDAGKIVKAKGKLSPEQTEVIERLNKLKYKAICSFGAQNAIIEIKNYFSMQ